MGKFLSFVIKYPQLFLIILGVVVCLLGLGGIGWIIGGGISAIGIVWLAKIGFFGSHRSASEGADDLFIELNKGNPLPIKDDYIYGSHGYKLGSIVGSAVLSRGRQIGTIKGNDISGLDGNLICRIVNGCLVK